MGDPFFCDKCNYIADDYDAFEKHHALDHHESIAEQIQAKQRQIDVLEYEINEIAKEYIPDFHWLDYEVSTFWACGESPIGMCVFKRDY